MGLRENNHYNWIAKVVVFHGMSVTLVPTSQVHWSELEIENKQVGSICRARENKDKKDVLGLFCE